MKKLILSVFFIIRLIFNAIGQQSGVELTGSLSVDSLQTISIRLIFDLDKEGNLTGNSITDFEGEDKTVSSIVGKYEVGKNFLSFKETGNLSTSSKAESSIFCFIEASGLKIQKVNEQSKISGSFKGFFKNGMPCAEGQIELQGDLLLVTPPKQTEPVAAVPQEKPDKKRERKQVEKNFITLGSDEVGELTDGASKNFKWLSDTLELEVWDQFEEDNDRVNIYFNGKLIHKSIEVKNRKRSFYFTVINASNTLRIEAENEGTNPPNTVNVRLKDRGDAQLYRTKLRKGESVNIEIAKNASANSGKN